MSKELILQFAERGQYSQVRAFAGEVLYTEGMPALHMYVVKDGEVDLYLLRDEKRTVVETLKKGQCFGIEPHMSAHVRLHNAAARTYCELYLIEVRAIIESVEVSPDLAKSMLTTLSERLSAAHRLIATRVNYQPDLLIYAQLLYLLGMADLGKQSTTPAVRGQAPAPGTARPLLQDLMVNARLMFGHSDKHIRGCVAKLLSLHIVRLEDSGNGKQLLFAPKDVVSQVRNVVNSDVDNDKLTYEYISVEEFAALLDIEPKLVLRKLASGEFAEDIFTFRRAEILRVLNEKGRRFFLERKIKPPSEFSDVTDLEFADQKSVFAVVAKVDTFDLAKVLSTLEEGAVKTKILASLSARRREEVESDLKGMGPVDPMEAQRIGKGIVDEIKALMMKQ